MEDPVVNDDADEPGSASGGSPSDARRMRSSEKTIPARTRTRHAPAIQATPRRLTPAVPALIRAGGRGRRPAGSVRARREVDAGSYGRGEGGAVCVPDSSGRPEANELQLQSPRRATLRVENRQPVSGLRSVDSHPRAPRAPRRGCRPRTARPGAPPRAPRPRRRRARRGARTTTRCAPLPTSRRWPRRAVFCASTPPSSSASPRRARSWTGPRTRPPARRPRTPSPSRRRDPAPPGAAARCA